MNTEFINTYLDNAGIYYENDVEMSRHTTFRIGGTASVVVYPVSLEEVSTVIRFLFLNGIRYFILGNGSNLLVSDNVPDIVFIKMSKINSITFEDNCSVTVGAGCLNAVLAVAALDRGYSGYEYAHGIPGSVGGAVFMNAGAYGYTTGEIVDEVIFVDNSGIVRSLKPSKDDFSYRCSPFTGKDCAVVFVCLRLHKGKREDIRALMDELMKKRRATQPLEYPSAGSVFKRPEGYFAGKLIEDSGLKGVTVGGAQVSEKHAGFIINKDNATSADVTELIDKVRETVYEKYSVTLEPEVKVI